MIDKNRSAERREHLIWNRKSFIKEVAFELYLKDTDLIYNKGGIGVRSRQMVFKAEDTTLSIY